MRIIFWLLLWATATICLAEELHDGIYGLYSGLVGNYTLTIPVLVDERGEELTGDDAKKRRKRNSDLNYKLKIENEDVILELFPSSGFISPNLVVERRNKHKRTRRVVNGYADYDADKTQEKRSGERVKRSIGKPKTIDTECHFVGKVRGHPNSKVALSVCDDGLGNQSTVKSKEHIVFKRTTVAPESKKKRRKKKRKHEKNCGTREPRRLREMRLEWQQQPGKMKVQGRARSRKSRWRRSVSKERYVEALIVADTSMMKFHQDIQVETYLLTIMNMVSALYQDPSIGNQVNIVVVNMILIEDEDSLDGLSVTINADRTLESFCKWQEQQNYEESHPNHHDVAILITREDICARRNTPCGTLGVAHVGGMCEKERSCNVNEDNGITLAHTITHELGHNFGMYHDTEKIGCPRREGSTQHVMTPSFEADTVHVAWSACSRRDITNFLDKGLGSCLDDKPEPDEQFQYPNLLAGAAYDASFQCQLQFGNSDMEVCTSLHEICFRLWCVVDGVCTTMLKPAAPGTSCGKHSWCINQECVPMTEQPDPIDGGWGDWSDWSECSRSCGAGVAIKERFCNNPVPAFGGKFCIGERKRYKICNTQDCPENTPSFRAVQCSSYDDQPFQGKKYKWIPYFDKADPCELYCSDEKDSIVVPWRNNAQDGTPCRIGTRDMCIHGICKKVGCDWEVDSEAKEDKCGVCKGDEKFYLNGKLEITPSGEYTVAGAFGLYEREKEAERVHIPGPTKEDIVIYIIFRGKYKNLGVAYNYTIPKQVPTTERQYECKCDSDRKPDKKMRVCNTQHCPTSFRRRTVLCIEQTEQEPVVYTQPPAIKSRKGIEYVENSMIEHPMMLAYMEEDILALPDSKCRGQEKPKEQEPCPHLPPCNKTLNVLDVLENGFFDENITSDRIMNFDRQEDKIRHERKRGNDTYLVFDHPKEKKNLNRKNKKAKRRRKERPKKALIEEFHSKYRAGTRKYLNYVLKRKRTKVQGDLDV
ncbi:UNVERIFIED_CONTAM: hypothetical protein PYX00_008622 [Menopon gallinae]|uniref:Peptidase M12B domain-containing protein n=1 Tax=Menopon gallinae TaxID=328185 RepID=A0AAW2HPM9_9NEOP